MLPHDDLGAGDAVVLLHAGVADRTMWSEHLRPLADAGYRVVAVDLPGFGEAPVAQDEDAPWRGVLLTMDALGIDRAALRERIADMQRRAYELQAATDWGPAGADPLKHDLAALAGFTAPVLVMVGEHDIHDFHVAADALVEALPNGQKTVLVGAGHLAPLEQPLAFRELLLDQLRSERL